MSPIYTYDGKIIIKNGSIASSESCCCGTPPPPCESDQDCCICTIVLDPLMNQFTCPDGYEPDYEYAGSNGEPACIKKTVISCDADPEECSDSDVSPWPGPWYGTISQGYCCNGACQETPCIDCNSPPATDSDPNISCECNSDYIGEYCGEKGDCFVTYLEPCPAFYAECCPLDCLEFQGPGGPIFLCDELP